MEQFEFNEAYHYTSKIDISPVYYEPEVFIDIPFTNDYMVSNCGNVYNKTKGYFLRYREDKDGYLKVVIEDKEVFIHRLVMMSFNPIPDAQHYQVNHKDARKYNNWLYNLEWCTRQQNMDHAVNLGLLKNNGNLLDGEDNINSKLTNEQVHEICRLLEKGLDYKTICNMINLDHKEYGNILFNIRLKNTWIHISNQYNFPNLKTSTSLLTNEQVHEVCRLLENGIRLRDVVDVISPNGFINSRDNYYYAVCDIRKRKSYKEISCNYNF